MYGMMINTRAKEMAQQPPKSGLLKAIRTMYVMQVLSKPTFRVVGYTTRWWFRSHLFNLHFSPENCFMTIMIYMYILYIILILC